MRTGIRPATREDAEFIGHRLRAEDAREVAACGLRPRDAVLISFRASDYCFTGEVDGEPAMIFGVGCSLFGETASVWALGTDACRRVPMSMVRIGRQVVAELLRVYPRLENYCDARYVESLRWLRLLGFTIDEPEPRGPFGIKFCHLFITRED